MKTIKIDTNLCTILENEQINPDVALKEFALMDLLSKKEKYLLEVKKFEKKYHADYHEFEKEVHSRQNEEDFEIEDDLLDWEFAHECLKAVEKNLEKLREKNDF